MPLSDPAIDTLLLPYSDAAIAEAATLIAAGQPVAVPTETVYGLAADATNGAAVAAIYAAKGRPSFNPLIVHVLGLAEARALVEIGEAAERLAAAFWPGPLTMVLPLRPGSPIAGLASAGLATLAVRSPAHPAMRALLEATGRPLAAPSANASGTISPTRAEHVARSLAGRIALVLDAGPAEIGLESTVVAVETDCLRVLRPGSIAAEALARVARVPVAPVASNAIEAPGQLAGHYAPAKPLRIDARERREGEWLIGYGAVAGDDTLSAAGSLVEAAARLFDALHLADAGEAPRIAVAAVPEEELGVAINDRLRRAARGSGGGPS